MRFLVLFLLLFAGCQKAPKHPEHKQILRTCISADINSMDPRKGVDMLSQGVVRSLFAGLVYLDQDLIPQLDIASSYTVSDDYKTYIFFLKDCKWSDGSPITASDFEETWKSALTPAFSSGNTNLFYFIKNGRKAIHGTVSIDQVGIQALDDKTIKIELEKPHSHFLSVLTNSVFSPVHSSMRYTPLNYKHLISSGPFRLKNYLLQNQITLEKNPYYWNADQIRLQEIDYYVIKDQSTAFMMFEKGEIDWLGDPLMKISADAIPSLKAQGVLHGIEGAGTQWLFFNTNKFPLNNANIRKALALAIDRNKIIHDVMHLDNPPPLGVIPRILKGKKWHPWFQDNDVENARKYFEKGLQELGITKADFPPITLNYAMNNLWTKVIQAIQQMWSENLGIQVKSEGTDLQIFIRKYYNNEHEIARLGWLMQYNDPVNLLDSFKFKNTQPNYTGWENAQYIQHADASYSCNEEKKWEHMEAAEKIFFDEMPSIPLVDVVALYVEQPYVKGVKVNYMFNIDFRWAYIDKS